MAGMRSAMRSPMRSALDQALGTAYMSLANQALAILRKFGTNAHVYLPGSTVTTYGGESASDSEFDNAALWSLTQPTSGVVSVSGGKMRVNSADGSYCIAISTNQVAVVGKTYRVTLDIESYTGTVAVGNAGGSNIPSGTGIVTVDWTAQEQQFSLKRSGGACDIVVRSYSVREKITTSSVTAGLPTNNYTLSDGSTGYSAVDGTAGLVLDAAGSLGALLEGAAAPLTGTTGFAGGQATLSFAAGEITITQTSGSYGQCVLSPPLVPEIGKTYRVEATFKRGTHTSILFQVQRGAPGGYATIVTTGTLTNTTNVTKELYFTATATDCVISVRGNGTTGDTSFVSALSVSEVTGIHATRATTANKPALRRGSYNLLTYSQAFSSVAWAIRPGAAFSSYTETSPTGSADAARVQGATQISWAVNSVVNSVVVASSTTYTGSYYVKSAGSATVAKVGLRDGSTGTFHTSAAIPISTTAWTRLTITATTGVATTQFSLGMGGADGDILVWGAQLEAGTTAGDYSPTTSAAASNPSAGRYSWQFDGTNDSLALGSVPFVLADDFLVVCAARVDRTANSGKLFSMRGAGSNPLIELSLSSGAPVAQLRDDAGVYVSRTHGSAITSMSVCTMWKVGTSVYLRVNGVQSGGALSVSGLGATTLLYAAAGAALVAGSPSNWFDGAMGPMLPIKGTFTEADVLTIERLVAANAPNGPTF